jgi:LPXTG-site transpeptidase (sortase) family protein
MTSLTIRVKRGVVLERVLLGVGLICVTWYAFALAHARYDEYQARATVERVLEGAGSAEGAGAESAKGAEGAEGAGGAAGGASASVTSGTRTLGTSTSGTSTPGTSGPFGTSGTRTSGTFGTSGTSGTFGEALGLLEIPRLGLSAPVVEGDDNAALRGAAGHLPDTPHPWENGNSAIAAHRDGLFRPLRHIRVGDEVRVQTSHGSIRYKVTDTHIVQPTDLSVLQPAAGPTLTLITCYPFYYVGSAPQRFIVHADRVN